MLKQRIITSLLMAIAFISSLFLFPPYGFLVFITVVLLIGSWEWANLMGLQNNLHRFLYSAISCLLMFGLALWAQLLDSSINDHIVLNVLLISGAWWALALLWIQGYPASAVLWGSPWVKAVMGWLVLLPTWLALAYLHQHSQGAWLILLVIITVFAADTGAYFFGRAYGKRKLAANVSPGKSWEGFWGGLICCLLLAVIVSWKADNSSLAATIAILLFTALASVLGDLLESMMKRQRGIKDSGYILPGHGGVLDRLDSITAAAPIFVLGVILSGWSF